MLFLSPWPIERNTGPLHNQLISWAAGVPWGGRLPEQISMSQNGLWKVLHLGNSPRGGSGSMQSGSPGLSLLSIFGTNWNVFWKVAGWCWSQPGPVPSPLAGRAHCSEFNGQGSYVSPICLLLESWAWRDIGVQGESVSPSGMCSGSWFFLIRS